MKGRLLLVIPPVVTKVGDVVEVDGDFANNLRAYLENFDHVTVACPVLEGSNNGLRQLTPFNNVAGHERMVFVPLPYTYREDRHFFHYRAVKKLLRSEIEKADYLLFEPHAPFDWSTLAARLAISMKRSYDIEADWYLESVWRLLLSQMPAGLKKIRKYIWFNYHIWLYHTCLKSSSVALLQGQDVFDAYKEHAPNPQKVLNVQITQESYISNAQLAAKLQRLQDGNPLIISYAGRAIEMKGPFDWLRSIHRLVTEGVKLQATWFGDGELLGELRTQVAKLEIGNFVFFPGTVERDAVMAELRKSDIFMFCHKTAESPRCLVEALACAAPIVGYGSSYARDLVGQRGGGAFVQVNDWEGLANLVRSLNQDRSRLVELISDANASARLYDRDKAIQQRIDLIKKYVKPPNRVLPDIFAG